MKPVLCAAAALALLCTPSALAKTKAHAAPPASASAMPALTGEPLTDALPAYAAFQADISLINGGSIQGPKDIERALDKAAALNRDALTRGFIAYGALTAARNPAFIESVRKTAQFYGREKTINGLLLAPKYAQSLEGGDQAIASVVRVALADSSRIDAAGESVKQRAREAQSLAWGKALSGAAAPRTQRLKALADAAQPALAPALAERLKVSSGDPATDPTAFGGAAFWRAVSAPPSDASSASGAASHAGPASDASLISLPTATPPAVTWTSDAGGADIRAKMVTLGALYALNATKDRSQDVERLLNDNITNGCLQGAQLQFYQCVASAHFNYENMACIGEAGLSTVASCVKDVAR